MEGNIEAVAPAAAASLSPPGDVDRYGAERLIRFAGELARTHSVISGQSAGVPLLSRFRDNRRALLLASRQLVQGARDGGAVSPTAEWLIDNFGLVEEQLREIQEDLPIGFYLELPKLLDGEMRGFPRVYALVSAYLSHTDNHFEQESLRRFVEAYQQVHPLTIGELWATAISVRLVLVENLRRFADSITERQTERGRADAFADALLAPIPPTNLRLRQWLLERAPLSTPFTVQLILRLRDRDPATAPGLVWLKGRLSEAGVDTDEVIRDEHLELAAMHWPVRAGITSMRALASVDWAEFVEGLSLVESELRRAGTQPADFATRDRYRHAVEELGRGSSWSERAIARRAVERAALSGAAVGSRETDPGYFLIAEGRAGLEAEVGYGPRLGQRLRRALPLVRTGVYTGAAVLATAAALVIPLVMGASLGASWIESLCFALLGLIPASELAMGLVNRAVTRLVGPRKLPKLALEAGVPTEFSTLVAVPTLLMDADEVRSLVERLEVNFLANDEGALRFALVTDWADADLPEAPGDAALLLEAQAGIAALNARYGSADGGDRFFLLHRGRRLNPVQGRWMGWERKRGKLHELNRLLRGATDTTFLAPCPALVAADVRYVITLDADTRLPRGAARRLVGAIAHPLNRPEHDPRTGQVVRGYAILQPRITPTLPEVGEGTLGQRVFSGPAGIDPYAFAISDVYQDLFGEGSFTGKGIYDVAAFETALAGRVPENALLSHDLFEGLHARAGLVSDIELFESFPAHHQVSIARQHRWARGDWQLVPWILAPGPISAIGRWKMADNLRRTLVAPLALTALLASWFLPGGRAWVWTLFVLASMSVPVVFPVLLNALPRRTGISVRSLLQDAADDLGLSLLRVGLGIALLPELAVRMVDAISRTAYRLLVSRRYLLEWVTAAQVAQGSRLRVGVFRRTMGPAAGLAAGIALLAAWGAPRAAALPGAFALLWALSPAIAFAISAPPVPRARRSLDAGQVAFLRLTARRTWRYFETFVTAEDHHLPPDNMQEDPTRAIAHRTSPTNIGLYLLSLASAHDLGWIGRQSFLRRAESTFSSLEALPRHLGHLYNWYDTTTLAPLPPRYVSTVDSGNLAGHLLAFESACLEYAAAPPPRAQALAGLADALRATRAATAATGDDVRAGSVRRRVLDEVTDEIAALLARVEHGDEGWTGLRGAAEVLVDAATALAHERGGAAYADVLEWAIALHDGIADHADEQASPEPLATRAERLTRVAARAGAFARGMQWGFLYDPSRRLFPIGQNIETGRADAGAYDLLASECRLASFLAIAQGDVPVSHWFRLGRGLTPAGAGSALVSWSGSMFEYLMPELVMSVPEGSLLAQTDRLIVARQIRYGAARGVPWGISEAAYNARDVQLTYQYANFGVSGLGLKRGLADDLVVAPYATALAAMVDPVAAVANLVRLAEVGAAGRYGYYESVDYTKSRLPDGAAYAVVKAFFAHHQGMSLVALANVVGDYPMRRRFHAAPLVQATELLLQERTPRNVAVARVHTLEAGLHLHVQEVVMPVLREFSSPHDPLPVTHRLSNGAYSVVLTTAGSGQSSWNGRAVTRWREDGALDAWGSFLYVRDVDSGRLWSGGHQPVGVDGDAYGVSFHIHRMEIRRRDGAITSAMDVVVSAEHDAEIRQLTLTNHGHRVRTLDVTSYAEVVLAPQAADVAHPAFSNLFVETEFDPTIGALLASRRPRGPAEARIWAAHVSAVHGSASSSAGAGVQFETDRARFLGRGRTPRNAAAIVDGHPLSNSVGSVLDPVFSLRRRVVLAPGEVVRVTFSTLVGVDRDRLAALCEVHRDPGIFERTAGHAWTHAQVQLRQLGIDPEEAQLYQRLASRVMYAGPTMRAAQDVLARNHLGQSALWKQGISGDLPILVGRITTLEDRDLVRQLVHAHCYWRLKGLSVDLVLLNEHAHTYGDDLHTELEAVVRASHIAGMENGVYLVRGEHLADADRDVLLTAARVVVDARNGALSDQILRQLRHAPGEPPRRPITASVGPDVSPPRLDLEFFNGLGGFSKGGRDYTVVLGARQWTPLPWVNVIANPQFGFVVSESGGGFTWADNSHENQLTPWSDDPVSDTPGEVVYVRDDETGETWTATPLPIREGAPYVVQHGQGYTSFTHESHGIALELVQFVHPQDPLKVSRLRLRNLSGRGRRLTVAVYVEWVLGTSRGTAVPYVVTSIDPETGALLARNAWQSDFADQVCFLDLGGRQERHSGDRVDWLGRNGDRAAPAGLGPDHDGSGAVGAGLDPCGVLLTTVRLLPGEQQRVVALLGRAGSAADATTMVRRARAMDPDRVLADVESGWDDVLGRLQVRTPDRAMDCLLNRWLLYQTLSCRVWARAGFYQAGGAYGFRDQLQDGMALGLAAPATVRAHLLRAAGRQFPEGDVQHWWHPPSGKGVRTRFSDDRVWLAYATAHYLDVTGDGAVLDEQVPFLDAQVLGAGVEDSYQEPGVSPTVGSVYEHVARALDASLEVGAHGLPKMGGGDWNDGMNRVGSEGKGESVWLAWFLIANLDCWAPIAEGRGDALRASSWSAHAAHLRAAVESEGWDGDWYRRAFTDDGVPLGSAGGVECRIDSIAQSWAVLSGAGRADRATRAMAAVDAHLVRRADALVLLLTPPFDRTTLEPGYIKGYVPGVRENGGQYTHAALWVVMAFAALGDGDRAAEIFAMLNPIQRTATRAGTHRYKGEPYVVAADVYAAAGHVGRGGWTWYTGSASWMYRAGVESILGVLVRVDRVRLNPCIPAHWPGYEVTLRHRTSQYTVTVVNPMGVNRGIQSIRVDGVELPGGSEAFDLVDDGAHHAVMVTLGPRRPSTREE